MRSVNSFKVVVFPAPLGPRNPTHLGPSSFKLSAETAVKEPYDFVRLTASSEGAIQLTTFLNRYKVAPSVTIAIAAMYPRAESTSPGRERLRTENAFDGTETLLTAFTA